MWRDGWRIGVSAAMLPLAALATVAAEKRPADAIAEMFANADKPAPPPASATATPTRPSLDYEMDMLRRARAEAAERGAAGKSVTSTTPRAELPKLTADQPGPAPPKARKPVEPLPNTANADVAATPSPAPKSAPPAAPAPAPIAANPTAPIARPAVDAESAPNATIFRIQIRKPEAGKPPALIADATKPDATDANEPVKPLQALAPDPAALPAPSAPPSVQPSAAPAPTAAQPSVVGRAPSDVRATILVILEGGTGTPDPILCVGETCAISAGLSTPARVLPRAEALALKTTRDATIDPCFGKAGCAFRDVPLAADAILQLVLIGSGDTPKSGDGFSIALDATCKRNGSHVECGRPLETTDFVAWIIPEAIAKEAGAAALEAAIAEGLPASEIAQTADK